MLLRLHLTASGGAADELAVHAHPTSTLSEVFALLGYPTDTRLSVAGQTVDGSSVLGRPPLVDGAVLRAEHTPPPLPRGAARLHVVSGPDAGVVRELSPGTHLLGRAAGCDIPLTDTHLSRRHASITLDEGGARVTDLASTNGTSVEGRPVGRPGLDGGDGGGAVSPGERITLGRSAVVVTDQLGEPASVRVTDDGTLAVNRAPRIVAEPAQVVVDVPAAPSAPDEPDAPVLMIVVPLVMSVAAAIALRSPLFLLFGLMAPVLAVGQHVSERRRRRRTHEAALRTHEESLRRAADAVARAAARELADRRRRCPDLARVAEVATERLDTLWTRRQGEDDHLLVGLGQGVLPARCSARPVDAPPRHPRLDAAPVAVRLDEAGVLGLSGPRSATLRLAHALIGQVAVWTSPRDVGIWLLASSRSSLADWRWATALPHARGADDEHTLVRCAALDGGDEQVSRRVDSLERLVRLGRRADSDDHDARPAAHVVIVDSGPALRAVDGLAGVLAAGPDAGVYAICLADRPGDLPVECRATAEVTADGELAVSGPAFESVSDGRADLAHPGWGTQIAQALAPLRDPRPDDHADLPRHVDLLDILDVDATRPDDLAASWSRRPRDLRAPVGVSASGVHHLDLAHDGPHILVGGMTGAGKSELLRTFVTSLAVLNRPDELTFVLVDYKGGAAFRDGAALPHVLGLVTDLDAVLTGRALRSLRAELRRREKAFGAAGVTDHTEYAARRDGSDLPALPRLVIVVDEFRALAEEHPDFVTGLVRIATLGRSLGVHLVLATQRPAGIVSAEIKANTNLRIALRVRDRGDSYDVIESDEAAALPSHTPGRAMLRTGGGNLDVVQIARIDTPGRPHLVTSVDLLDLHALGEPPPAARQVTTDTAGTLARVVSACHEARERLQVPDVAAPWLPALPERIDVDSLDDAAPPAHLPGCGTPTWLTLGLIDDPDEQRQTPLRWQVHSGGHLALIGGSRTGRTSALRTLASLVARHTCPAAVHLHVVDSSGALADLVPGRGRGTVDHLGTYVTVAEAGRLRRLLTHLLTVIRARESTKPAPANAPTVVVLVDGWERLRDTLEGIDHGDGLRDWYEILRAGPSVGVRCVVTGGRSLLSGTVSTLLGERLLLHLPDPSDALIAGVPAAHAPPDIPGRARRPSDGLELQLAIAAPTATRPAHAATCLTDASAAPVVLHPLPATLTRTELRDRAPRTPPPALRLPSLVGVGADHLLPTYAELADGLLVVGQRGSGRTTALRSLLDGLEALDTEIWITPGSASSLPAVHHLQTDPLDDDRSAHRADLAATTPRGEQPPITQHRRRVLRVDPHDVGALEVALSMAGRTIVVGDDVERWWDSGVEEALADAVRRRSVPVVVAGSTRAVAGRYRGLTANLRRTGTGLVLHPCPGDRDVFDIALPTGDPTPPGRAALVTPAGALLVQVANAVTAPPGQGRQPAPTASGRTTI